MLTSFVEANLDTDEIMSLGRRIADHHGLNTFGPLDRKHTVTWFRDAIAGSIAADDATRYLRELERRMLMAEPFVTPRAATTA